MRSRWAVMITLLAVIGAAPDVGAETSGACGPNGRVAATGQYGSVVVLDGDGTTRSELVPANATLVSADTPTAPSWSPDGWWLAYGVTHFKALVPVSAEIQVESVGGRENRRVITVPAASQISEVSWSPDGRRLAFVLWTRNLAVELATWTGWGDHASVYVVNLGGDGARPVAEVGGNLAGDLTWAPDGHHLAFTSGTVTGTVHVVDVDAPVPLARALTDPTLDVRRVRWSPDGAHLAMVARHSTTPLEQPALWVMDADGAHARPLPIATWDPPSWSPDGRWVTASEGEPGIAVVAVDTGEIRRITVGRDWSPAWSSDGRRIAFNRDADFNGLATLWTVDLATGEERRISSMPDLNPTWCPVP